MGEFLIGLFAIAFVWGIVAAIVGMAKERRARKSIAEKLRKVPNFNATKQCVGEDGLTAIALDEEGKKICLLAVNHAPRVIEYRDILACELFQDGDAVTKTVRSSQAAGAIIGGLAFGGLGAVVGGLSGSTTTSKKVRRIELRVVVNDTSHPTHDVCIMNKAVKQGHPLYEQAMRIGRHWHALIDVLIKRADEADRVDAGKSSLAGSVADELRKIADLRNEGILSDAEYEAQKARLMA